MQKQDIETYLAERGYILALKLLAGRQKDSDDILALCHQLNIQTREQAQELLDRYVPDKHFQQLSHVDDTLDDVF